jgi:superfamily II DNA or RNA helicase
MKDLPQGLYEKLLTAALREGLASVSKDLLKVGNLEAAEAPDRIALHVSRVLQRALEDLPESDRVTLGIELARKLIDQIHEMAPEIPLLPGQVLQAVLARRPDGEPDELSAPLTPLLDSTLLTNAPGEPRVGSQLVTEIPSSDRIDLVMAFIRKTGLAPFRESLQRFRSVGKPIRVLTTTYTGTTEAAALDILKEMGAEVRVSYEMGSTRLHAKAWIFHRYSGGSTAYIGSSNLTHSAQQTGMEWNVRVSGLRNPDIVSKMSAVFEAYWNNRDFEPYDREDFLARIPKESSDQQMFYLSPIEIRLEPFQDRMLEEIEICREQGRHRNLLVSATGTGKTVMAAVDYSRLKTKLRRSRLLFVAHRAEILNQARATFAQALREPSFGEMWIGNHRPKKFEHVFASIQSLHANGLEELDPTHFDVVIVDEFHHAAAHSYRALLDRVRPQELLGLTATPERSDGLPLLDLFDGRIAAELRLWDAIDQHRLCPFAYFGIHDGTDLRRIPWRKGTGYDVEALSNVFTTTDGWARLVIKELVSHVDDLDAIRALGFCVSIDHARYMARVFREAGIPSIAIWGDTPELERRQALGDLRDGKIKVVFSVDLFNEGVDVPVVDTLLLLRPTDSPILFIQQLGRGLRLSKGKSRCVVLDFVGHQHADFKFDRRLRALLGGSRKGLREQVELGFPLLPAGCHMELDRLASSIILENLKQATPSRWQAKVQELQQIAASGKKVTLERFLNEAELELEDIYSGGKCWSDLCEHADISVHKQGPEEGPLRKACGRLLHVDDAVRLTAYQELLASKNPPKIDSLGERQRRLLRMLVASIADQVLDKSSTLQDACELLWKHPQVCAELRELFPVLAQSRSHLHVPLALNPDVPLQIHARYSRIEILSAMGVGTSARVSPWQTGVWWASDARADLFAFTLDKTSGHFSPTTRYRDYAISPDLIHWESQSTTRAEGETGTRYQNHAALGTSILLFTRLHQGDRAFWFLGPATYVKHESELPMAITWRLQHPLPGDLFAQFAAAVA